MPDVWYGNRMALPRYIPHYTVEDYQMWQGHWELWSGVPIAMSPSPSRRHQQIASNLHFFLRQALSEGNCQGCEVLFETDWRVEKDTVLRPDMLIACHHEPSQFIEKSPQFVAEILSESTRQRDLLYKRDMYQSLEVGYYLIIDPDEESHQLLRWTGGGYVDATTSLLQLHQDCEIEPELDRIYQV